MEYKLTTYDISIFNNSDREEDIYLSRFIELAEHIRNSNDLDIGEEYDRVNYYKKLKSKIQFDINSETIKDNNKRTISFLDPRNNPYNQNELQVDINQSTISGLLYGGKIADNEVLLKLSQSKK